jgi:hypothetical protein
MANLSIFNGLLQPPKSVADYDLEAANVKRAGLQNQTLDFQNQAAQRGADRANQLLALSKGLPQGASDLDRLAALRNGGFYDEADKLSTSLDNRSKSVAAAAKDTADAASTTQKAAEARKSALLRAVPTFSNSDDVKKFLTDGVAGGHITMEEAQQMVSRVPDSTTNMQGFKDWQLSTLRGLMAPEKQMEYVAPKADTVLTNQTSSENNERTNTTHVKTVGIQQAGEDRRAALHRDVQFKVAGIDPQTGNFVGGGAGPDSGGGMSGMVDALGGYKIDPNTAFARMQPAMKAGIIAQVQAKYPDYDPTTYSAKRKAATDFTSGTQGNALRSFAVGLDHLDQLGKLADALDNGDIQLINKFGNAIAAQTGNPAPTNFNAAKEIVGKEIVKAVVGGGGGVEERREIAQLLKDANSPAQLRGVINTFTGLMSAQHEGLMTQRRAAGLPDSTLPVYKGHGAAAAPAPAAPTGFKIIGVK